MVMTADDHLGASTSTGEVSEPSRWRASTVTDPHPDPVDRRSSESMRTATASVSMLSVVAALAFVWLVMAYA